MDVREQFRIWFKDTQLKKRVLGGAIALVALALILRSALGPSLPATLVQKGPVIQKVVASGLITPKAKIRISAQVNGTLEELLSDEGETVHKGQILARISNAEASALVEQARAAYEQAQAKADQFQGVSARLAKESLRQAEIRLNKARLAAEREELLAKSNASTQEALDQARNELQLAESQFQGSMAQAKAAAPKGSDSRMALAAVDQSHGALSAAEAKLELYTIISPIDAKVISRSSESGDAIQTGSPLFLLASTEAFRAKVQVDEKYLALLVEGQAAEITADAYPGRTFAAKVERIAPAVNQDRGSVEVQLIIPEAPPYLRYDMSASVEIITNTSQASLLIPIEAVSAAATEHPFVYTLSDGKIRKQELKLGLRGDTQIEVTQGLAEQDIVLYPSEGLSPGSRARPDLKGWPRAL